MKAAVFDLDGTLIDSAPDLRAAANAVLAERGRETLSLDVIVSFIGNGVPKLVERCLNATGGFDEGALQEAIASFHRFYNAEPLALTRLYPHVEAALEALAQDGWALGVCTNKPEAPAVAILEQLGLRDRFGSVIGGDRLAKPKPDPAMLRLCFDELGTDSSQSVFQGVFVGDSETDEATALATGVRFALFTRGYRKKPPEMFEADIRFDDYSKFVPLLGVD